jgi:hypothetical protein
LRNCAIRTPSSYPKGAAARSRLAVFATITSRERNINHIEVSMRSYRSEGLSLSISALTSTGASSAALVKMANGEYTAASVDKDQKDALKLGLIK